MTRVSEYHDTYREWLNKYRDFALYLPVGHKLRTRYRDLSRFLHNVKCETLDHGVCTTAPDSATTDRMFQEFTDAVEVSKDYESFCSEAMRLSELLTKRCWSEGLDYTVETDIAMRRVIKVFPKNKPESPLFEVKANRLFDTLNKAIKRLA